MERPTVSRSHRSSEAGRNRRSLDPRGSRSLFLAGLLAFIVAACAACRRQTGTPPQHYIAFVANQQGNSIAAVDLGNFQVVSSISVPPAPSQVTIRPGAKEIYAVSTTGSISVIAYPELRIKKTISVGTSASSLVFSADGHRAYVLDPSENQAVAWDCVHGRELGRLRLPGKPSSIALSPDGRALMVSALPSDLLFVDPESMKLLGKAEVGGNPGPMSVRADGKVIFVSATGQKSIAAVEIPSRQLLANLAVAAPVTSLVFKPDGGELYALSSTGSVTIILDAYHDDVEQTITAGLNPAAGIFRQDMTTFYIATAGDGNVTALDVQTRNVISVVHAGTQPGSLALTPDQRFLAVTDAATSSLAVLRTDKLGLVTTVPVGADPVHVVIPDWLWQGGR